MNYNVKITIRAKTVIPKMIETVQNRDSIYKLRTTLLYKYETEDNISQPARWRMKDGRDSAKNKTLVALPGWPRKRAMATR